MLAEIIRYLLGKQERELSLRVQVSGRTYITDSPWYVNRVALAITGTLVTVISCWWQCVCVSSSFRVPCILLETQGCLRQAHWASARKSVSDIPVSSPVGAACACNRADLRVPLIPLALES